MLSVQFSAANAGEHPCATKRKPPTGFKNCDEVQRYRKTLAGSIRFEKSREASLTFMQRTLATPENLACPFDRDQRNTAARYVGLEDGVRHTDIGLSRLLQAEVAAMSAEERILDSQVAISLQAREFAEIAEQKRVHDLGVILGWLRQHGETKISPKEIHDAVYAVREHVDRANGKMTERYRGGIESSYVGWFEEYVGDQIRDAYEKETQGRPKPFVESLNDLPTDAARFNALVARALERDQGQDFRDGLTPYHARMILLYFIYRRFERQNGRLTERGHQAADSFARKLVLRFNVTDTGSQNGEGGRVEHGWDSSIFHDGYIYGAKSGPARELLQPLPEDANCETSCCGTDCSVFIQQSIGASGLKLWEVSSGRITTKAMLENFKEEKMDTAFSKELLCSEEDLKIGDVIVYPGHTMMFTGYVEGPNGREMMMVEAVGGNSRTLRHSRFSLYPTGSGCKDSHFTTNPKKLYYRVRLKVPLQLVGAK